ncbi:hypothetical protein [Stigmatella aurantiaca]|uniref:Uncharacterized protein n=1 Tax=Stigmatella aurantiaca (strain DW4/3-1) TaxID=378806 RepID=Q08P71_STIAD|nr:hypothetical protein [Stigmatella aurantiaca]ADO68203.1 uncharacterized protein STAUR_0394 [Stigmatella aurantiaca DW4/3-1]EAU62274.1 hypothetical protein STIAU_1818 [Stigmatella aurantiaca DW4/3-1]
MPSFSLATLGGAPPLTLPSMRPLAVGLGGSALFGFALRTAVSHEGLSVTHLSWAFALPAVSVLSWALCLPALYILWATRHPNVGASHCVLAARDAFHTLGLCLASTTPILWFFAATAPGSQISSVLAFLFTSLALFSSVHAFVQALQHQGASLSGFPRLAFFCLHTITFAQCAHGAGLSLS